MSGKNKKFTFVTILDLKHLANIFLDFSLKFNTYYLKYFYLRNVIISQDSGVGHTMRNCNSDPIFV